MSKGENYRVYQGLRLNPALTSEVIFEVSNIVWVKPKTKPMKQAKLVQICDAFCWPEIGSDSLYTVYSYGIPAIWYAKLKQTPRWKCLELIPLIKK